MAEAQNTETTQLLRAWAAGDQQALVELTPQVYKELRRIAGHCMQRERPGRTIQTTALVHEAWLRMVDVMNVDWQHRAHFFAVSARMMRRILLDRARKRVTSKHGGGAICLKLDEIPDVSSRKVREIIALDDALGVLEKMDPRRAQVVELRFFGGLSVEETAAVLKVSLDTVMRDWKLARAWLLTELSGEPGSKSLAPDETDKGSACDVRGHHGCRRIRVITGTLRYRVRNVTRDTSIGDAIDTAGNSAERRTGLLKHDKLDEGAGLWIVPCEAVHTFFMKFAIDLIYLDRKRRVRGVVRALRPWRLSMCLPAHSVLELPPGTIDRTKTEKGDQVELVAEKDLLS